MNIALLGFGTVGKAFYELTLGRSDLRVTSVLSRRPRPELPCTVTNDFDEIVRDRSVGIVVEVMGGLEPAYRYICAAMRAGKHVVTANKQLVCAHYDELLELARECGVSLRCTAAAGGGIPWLSNLEKTLEQEPVVRISGIMNGTTNYILDRMHTGGGSFSAALAQAQALGYAEADPTQDLNGGDIRRKLVISANIAFGCVLDEREVAVMGIEALRAADIAAFRRMGRVCKLVAGARKLPDGVAAYIEPALFPPSAHEAAVPENFNLISLTGLHIGKQSFYGQGAGRYPTAYNVLQDCVDVRNGRHHFYTSALRPAHVDNRSIARPYYVRTEGIDKWLQSHIDKILDCGIITEPVTVTEIHQWAQERKQTGAECFFASLR